MKYPAIHASIHCLTAMVVLGAALPANAAGGDAGSSGSGSKTLIDYFLPTPITCPLTKTTWGSTNSWTQTTPTSPTKSPPVAVSGTVGVIPRDTCNGIEASDLTSASAMTYWDHKVLFGPDGKYHMYVGQWSANGSNSDGKTGFAAWGSATLAEAVSDSLMGPYKTLSSAPPVSGKVQNISGIPLNNGSYLLIYTALQILTSPSLVPGTWQHLSPTMSPAASSTSVTENETIAETADGTFIVIGRAYDEYTAKTPGGPYTKQGNAGIKAGTIEDPLIWCSGGQFHLVANDWAARKAYHYTSNDGINNWKDMGLAYDPTSDFVRYTDGTVNHWYKMERPGVVMANGHVQAFTFAVIDYLKEYDVANDNHASKVIVVPFDGVSFDRDNPGPGSAACPLTYTGPMTDAGMTTMPTGGSGSAAPEASTTPDDDSGGGTTIPSSGDGSASSGSASSGVAGASSGGGTATGASGTSTDSTGGSGSGTSEPTSGENGNAASSGDGTAGSPASGGSESSGGGDSSKSGGGCSSSGSPGGTGGLGALFVAAAAIFAGRRRRSS